MRIEYRILGEGDISARLFEGFERLDLFGNLLAVADLIGEHIPVH